jgi:hypothetical protein
MRGAYRRLAGLPGICVDQSMRIRNTIRKRQKTLTSEDGEFVASVMVATEPKMNRSDLDYCQQHIGND